MLSFHGCIWAFPTADVPRHLPRAIVWIPRWDPQPLMSVSHRRDPHNQAYLLGIGIREVYYMAGGLSFGEFIVFGVWCRCFHFLQTSQLLRRIQAHCAKLQLYSHVHLFHFPCKNSKRTSCILLSPERHAAHRKHLTHPRYPSSCGPLRRHPSPHNHLWDAGCCPLVVCLVTGTDEISQFTNRCFIIPPKNQGNQGLVLPLIKKSDGAISSKLPRTI